MLNSAMKNYLILIILTALVGCNNAVEDKVLFQDFAKGATVTIEHDSCEYVVYYSECIIHKHNCKFCKQRVK